MSAPEPAAEPLLAREQAPGLLPAILLPLSTAAFLVGLWHVLVVASGSQIFPSPMEVLRGLAELARKGVLASYIGDSLWRVGCARPALRASVRRPGSAKRTRR